MAIDAWKNFELSGKISDYLNYRQSTKEAAFETSYMPAKAGGNDRGEEKFSERGMCSYGAERDSDGNGIKCHADWRI